MSETTRVLVVHDDADSLFCSSPAQAPAIAPHRRFLAESVVEIDDDARAQPAELSGALA